MTPEQFAYWLQGFAEISGKVPTEEQWQEIKNHLATVFFKVTNEELFKKLTEQYKNPTPGTITPISVGPKIYC